MYEAPLKLSLVNLATNAVLKAQFNPEELSIDLKAVWNKMIIPGMSHPIRQFSHTDTTAFEFDLAFRVTTPSAAATEQSFQEAGLQDLGGSRGTVTNSRFTNIPLGQQDTRFSIADREYAENFLRALTVPTGVGSIYESAPPNVLVVWPGYCTFEASVESVRIKHQRFNRNMSPTHTTISVSVCDVHDMRFTSQDVMLQGFNTPRTPKSRGF